MADRYWDRDRDRGDRPGDAWRERDERWRSQERDRPLSERASDEVRSWFGDDEARRRRERDELREDRGVGRERWTSSGRDDERDDPRRGAWGRGERSGGYERDRGERWSGGADLTRERDFGRSDRYANTDEGLGYGTKFREDRYSSSGRGREEYRGTSGYEAGRVRPYGDWDRVGEASPFMSSATDWESGPFVGRGPRNYQRSDDRIRDEICERLTRHGRIDATDINIKVVGGDVTLDGSVGDRDSKRLAEDVAEAVFGVKDVNNQIRVHRSEMQPVGTAGRSAIGETPREGENTGSVLGLAGTSNTPELTPPDREQPKKT